MTVQQDVRYNGRKRESKIIKAPHKIWARCAKWGLWMPVFHPNADWQDMFWLSPLDCVKSFMYTIKAVNKEVIDMFEDRVSIIKTYMLIMPKSCGNDSVLDLDYGAKKPALLLASIKEASSIYLFFLETFSPFSYVPDLNSATFQRLYTQFPKTLHTVCQHSRTSFRQIQCCRRVRSNCLQSFLILTEWKRGDLVFTDSTQWCVFILRIKSHSGNRNLLFIQPHRFMCGI